MDDVAFDGFKVRVDFDRWPAKILRALLRRHYEKHELRLVRRLVRPDDRIVELGSAIGVVALAAGRIANPSNIVCYDANPDMVAQATANFALNDARTRACHAVLVNDSDARASLTFHKSPYFLGSSLLARDADAETINVPARPLAAALAEADANVLIVDIEGAEAGLLDATDLGPVETLILEMHVSMLGIETCAELVAALAGQGLMLDARQTAYNSLVFRRSGNPPAGRTATEGFVRDYLSAIAHWEAGWSDAAARDLAKAIEAVPDCGFAHLLRSQIIAAGGGMDDTVLEAAEGATRLDAGNEDALEHLAEIQGRRGALDEARAALEQAIAVTPSRPLFHAGLGTVLARQGHHEEALGAFRNAAGLCPARAARLDFIAALATRADKHTAAPPGADPDIRDERRFFSALAKRVEAFRLGLPGQALSHALDLAPDDRGLASALAALLATPKDVRAALEKSL